MLRITIGNPAGNTVSLAGINFTDPFPAGMSVAATPAFTNTCGGVVASGDVQGDMLLRSPAADRWPRARPARST